MIEVDDVVEMARWLDTVRFPTEAEYAAGKISRRLRALAGDARRMRRQGQLLPALGDALDRLVQAAKDATDLTPALRDELLREVGVVRKLATSAARR